MTISPERCYLNILSRKLAQKFNSSQILSEGKDDLAMKVIRMPDEIWKRLTSGREVAISEAEKEGDELLVAALKDMTVAAFGRFLIEQGLKDRIKK